MNYKKRYFSIILVLFTSIFFGQNKFETYETEIFKIQYPMDWSLQTSNTFGASFTISSPLLNNEDKFKENINLIVQDLKEQNIDLDQYVSISKNQLKSLPKIEFLESKRLGNKNLEYHSIIFKAFLRERNLMLQQIYIIKKGVAYVLTFTSLEKDYDLYKNISEKILNSFKLK